MRTYASTVPLTRNEVNLVDLYLTPVSTQGDGRTYSYVVALSSDDYEVKWDHIFTLAKIIPKLCHNVNRLVETLENAISIILLNYFEVRHPFF